MLGPEDLRMKEDRSREGDPLHDPRKEEEGGLGTTDTSEECCLHGIKVSEFCEKCIIDHRARQARDEW